MSNREAPVKEVSIPQSPRHGDTTDGSTRKWRASKTAYTSSRGGNSRGQRKGANEVVTNRNHSPSTPDTSNTSSNDWHDRIQSNFVEYIEPGDGIPDVVGPERWHIDPNYTPKLPVCNFENRLTYADYDFVEARKFLSTSCTPLPIFDHNETLFNVIENHHVTVLSGETGCGKSSGLPMMLLHLYRQLGRKLRCFVAQPRRVAAIRLAERVVSELGEENIGGSVGVRISREVEDTGCPIIFATTGYLLQWFAHNPNALDQVTHLVLDEVHERTIDQDLLCLLARRHLNTRLHASDRRPNLRLIIMSATLNAKGYSDYFTLPDDPVPYRGLPLLVGAKRFPVQCVYASELINIFPRLNNSTEWSDFQRVLSQHDSIAQVMNDQLGSKVDVIDPVDDSELKLINTKFKPQLKRLSTVTTQELLFGTFTIFNYLDNNLTPILNDDTVGAVLVFLPGEAELLEMHDLLRNVSVGSLQGSRKLSQNSFRMDVHILHSSVERAEVDKAFLIPEHGVHKIVLATNIAESSVTIPDVKLVIDYGRRRTIEYEESSKTLELTLGWTSRASAIQRLGRAGRVGPGVCIRMYSTSFFSRCLNPYDDTEISQMPLDQVILRTKNLFPSVDTVELLNELIDPPESTRIRESLDTLFRTGAITNPSDPPWFLTFYGMTVPRLVTGVAAQAALLIMGSVLGLGVEGCIMAASASSQDFFTQPNANYFNKFDRSQFEMSCLKSFSGRYLCDFFGSEPIAAFTALLKWCRLDVADRSMFLTRYSIMLPRWRHFRGRVAQLAHALADLLEEHHMNQDGQMYEEQTAHVHDCVGILSTRHSRTFEVPHEVLRLRALVKLMGFGSTTQRSRRGKFSHADVGSDTRVLMKLAFQRIDHNVNVLPSASLLKEMRMLLILAASTQSRDLVQTASLRLDISNFFKVDKSNVNYLMMECLRSDSFRQLHPTVKIKQSTVSGLVPVAHKQKDPGEYVLYSDGVQKLKEYVLMMAQSSQSLEEIVSSLKSKYKIKCIDHFVETLLETRGLTFHRLVIQHWGVAELVRHNFGPPSPLRCPSLRGGMSPEGDSDVVFEQHSPPVRAVCPKWLQGFCIKGARCPLPHECDDIPVMSDVANVANDSNYVITNWLLIRQWVQIAFLLKLTTFLDKFPNRKNESSKNNKEDYITVGENGVKSIIWDERKPTKENKKKFLAMWVQYVIDDLKTLYVDDTSYDNNVSLLYRNIAEGICQVVERYQSLDKGNYIVNIPTTRNEMFKYLEEKKNFDIMVKLFIDQWGCHVFANQVKHCICHFSPLKSDGTWMKPPEEKIIHDHRISGCTEDDLVDIFNVTKAVFHKCLGNQLAITLKSKKSGFDITTKNIELVVNGAKKSFLNTPFAKANPFALTYCCQLHQGQLLEVVTNTWRCFGQVTPSGTPLMGEYNLEFMGTRELQTLASTLNRPIMKESLSRGESAHHFSSGEYRLETFDALLGRSYDFNEQPITGSFTKAVTNLQYWFASPRFVSFSQLDEARTVKIELSSQDPFTEKPNAFCQVSKLAFALSLWAPERIITCTYGKAGPKGKAVAFIEFPAGSVLDSVPAVFTSQFDIHSNCRQLSFGASSFWYTASVGVPMNSRISFKLVGDEIPEAFRNSESLDPSLKNTMTTSANGAKPGFELGRLQSAAKWQYGADQSRGKPKFYWRCMGPNLFPIIQDSKTHQMQFFIVSLTNLLVGRNHNSEANLQFNKGHSVVNRCSDTTIVPMDGLAALVSLVCAPELSPMVPGMNVEVIDGKIYSVNTSLHHDVASMKHGWCGQGISKNEFEVVNEFRELRSRLYVVGDGFSQNKKFMNAWQKLIQLSKKMDDTSLNDRPSVTVKGTDVTHDLVYENRRKQYKGNFKSDATTPPLPVLRMERLSEMDLYPSLLINKGNTHSDSAELPSLYRIAFKGVRKALQPYDDPYGDSESLINFGKINNEGSMIAQLLPSINPHYNSDIALINLVQSEINNAPPSKPKPKAKAKKKNNKTVQNARGKPKKPKSQPQTKNDSPRQNQKNSTC
eukprot:GHVH01004425.1.p1 GENE.GHVH01004425.1~~GHVH01004425.1.p1  ORF type:complete len:2024 (+),score=220.28 GHVH01004425.1:135-6206(+)